MSYKKIDDKIIKVKREWKFTEKVIIALLIYVTIIFTSALVFAFIFISESIFWYLLPAIGALGSSGLGFFIWKEKNENLIKIRNNPDYDNEQFKSQLEYQLQQELLDINREDNNNYY